MGTVPYKMISDERGGGLGRCMALVLIKLYMASYFWRQSKWGTLAYVLRSRGTFRMAANLRACVPAAPIPRLVVHLITIASLVTH